MTETKTQKKWYDYTLIVFLLCLFFFPIGLYALWKNKNITKGWKIITTVLISVFVLVSLGDKEKNNITEVEKTVVDKDRISEKHEEIKEKDPNQEFREELESEIKSLNEKGFDGSAFREDIQSIQIEIVLFNVWAIKIKKAEKSKDTEILKLGKQLKRKVKSLQISEFPKIRKAYKAIIYKKLWLENIETRIKGKNNTILEFTGGIFASNKVKQETQETLSEILRMLRFKQVNYKFTKYDSEYTYYTMKTLNDREVVEIE